MSAFRSRPDALALHLLFSVIGFIVTALVLPALRSQARAGGPSAAPAEKAGMVSASPGASAGSPCRIFWVLRHAEKIEQPIEDPDLTEAGRERAGALVRLLECSGVDALYATDTRRAWQTLEPLGETTGLLVSVHHIDDPYGMARRALNGPGSCAVIVAHGDTVVPIIEGLGALQHEDFGRIVYDDLFLVTVAGPGSARVIRLKYGGPPAASGGAAATPVVDSPAEPVDRGREGGGPRGR